MHPAPYVDGVHRLRWLAGLCFGQCIAQGAAIAIVHQDVKQFVVPGERVPVSNHIGVLQLAEQLNLRERQCLLLLGQILQPYTLIDTLAPIGVLQQPNRAIIPAADFMARLEALKGATLWAE